MPKIEHVVVLMLEIRSFDCMLGYLYPKSEAFDGLDGSESNPWHRPDGSVAEIPVWNSPAIRPEAACIPNRELGELFADINMQLYGLETVQDGAPSMRGFVDNLRQPPEDGRLPDPRAVMHCFKPAQLPLLSQLATAFGVSDRWHASAPCETWPNRYFAHAGTGGGYVNNEFLPLPRLNLRPLIGGSTNAVTAGRSISATCRRRRLSPICGSRYRRISACSRTISPKMRATADC